MAYCIRMKKYFRSTGKRPFDKLRDLRINA